jgi:hypothetical protein
MQASLLQHQAARNAVLASRLRHRGVVWPASPAVSAQHQHQHQHQHQQTHTCHRLHAVNTQQQDAATGLAPLPWDGTPDQVQVCVRSSCLFGTLCAAACCAITLHRPRTTPHRHHLLASRHNAGPAAAAATRVRRCQNAGRPDAAVVPARQVRGVVCMSVCVRCVATPGAHASAAPPALHVTSRVSPASRTSLEQLAAAAAACPLQPTPLPGTSRWTRRSRSCGRCSRGGSGSSERVALCVLSCGRGCSCSGCCCQPAAGNVYTCAFRSLVAHWCSADDVTLATVQAEFATGKSFVYEHCDKRGRPVLIITASKHNIGVWRGGGCAAGCCCAPVSHAAVWRAPEPV